MANPVRKSWRIERGLRIALLACAMSRAFPAASGQTIELTRELTPPALPAPALGAAIVQVLESEAADMHAAATGNAEQGERAAAIAGANLRLLAAERLAAGERAGPAGSVLMLQGMKLAFAREELDRFLLERCSASEPGGANIAALEAVAAFNRGFEDHVSTGVGATPIDAASPETSDWFAELLGRLLPLASDESGRPAKSHWIVTLQSAAIETPAGPDGAATIEQLRARVTATALDANVQGTLLSVLDFLERGGRFADLAPRVASYQRTVAELLNAVEAIDDATWLDLARREAMLARATEAIGRFSDPDQRQAGADAAGRLALWSSVLRPATFIQRDNIDDKTLRAIVDGLAETEAKASAADVERALTQTAVVLERMRASRMLPENTLTRELRITERNLAKEYRAVEAKTLKAMAEGALLKSVAADPGLSSLLADHRERLEDLQQLRRMPGWSATIAAIYPPAAKDFDTQMRRRAADLLVPTKRSEARLALARFEEDFERFAGLPFEQSLAKSTPAAAQLAGGLQAEVLALAIAQRRAWIAEWARAEPDPKPGLTMAQTHRLMQALRDSAALIELEPEYLNRWPGWQMNAEAVAGGQSDVVTRLRLACAAAVQAGADGDPAPLREQLDRMERESPLAKLAGRMMSELGGGLRELPAGAAGTLAQLAIEPTASATWLKHRANLARACRYTAEADHARDAGNADAARQCREYAEALARELIELLDAG